MQRLLGDVRRADERFSLIAPDSFVAVGLSGGKDSLALLSLLAAYRKIKPFRLCALTLVPKGRMDVQPLRLLCAALDVPYYTRESALFDELFDKDRQSAARKSPCALCARVRRGALVRMAKEHGCDTLALGHHLDDALATLLMAVLREGRFHTLAPKAVMGRENVTVIRPLILTRESALSSFCSNQGLIPVKNPCPADGHMTRAEMTDLLRKLEAQYKDAAIKMTGALLKQDFFMGADAHEPPENEDGAERLKG